LKRFGILILLALAIAAWFALDLGHYLTLAALKSQQAWLASAYRDNPLLVLGAFFLVYVAFTGASIPGAGVLTLAAGAIFGLVLGTALVSFASTIGATLAFLASRYLFHDAVQARFAGRLRPINAGMARDGPFYLFTLRLVPVVPFFAINLLMGLTPIRVVTFFWVSQLGMFLGTVVYVNAGTQLARIENLRDIATPGLLLSFVALGLLPWAGKAMMGMIAGRRLYARWHKPGASIATLS